MNRVGDETTNDEGKRGRLSKTERDDMAIFLLGVPYPPAQKRAYTNVISSEAEKGFKLFHIEGDHDGKPRPNVCGDCHRMPFLVSTNTPGTGMDTPTWRGAYDRWLILPQGRMNLIDFDFYRKLTEAGTPEREIWRLSWGGRKRFDPVWNMVLEGSTGFSGAFARQLTLNTVTTRGQSEHLRFTHDLLDALERAARDGGVILQGEGVSIEGAQASPVALQFTPQYQGGVYVETAGDHRSFTRGQLLILAAEGRFVGTFTARMGANVDVDNPQPALWTLGPIQEQRGHQKFPILYTGNQVMTLSGRHLQDQAHLIVDGVRVAGTLKIGGETVEVELETLPPAGMHFLQVQNPDGLVSNDFIFHVTEDSQAAEDLDGQNLGEILRRSRWDRLIGTWVDAETNGAGVKTTFAWKIQDKVIEVTTREPKRDVISLLTIEGKTGQLVQTGADSLGATFQTRWELEDQGDAVLSYVAYGQDGKESKLGIRQHFDDQDTLIRILAHSRPVTVRMKRMKSE